MAHLVMNFRRSVIIAVLRRSKVASRKKLHLKNCIFCIFVKRTTNWKIFKILFQKDSSPHRSTCCVQISWNLAQEIGKIVRCSPGKKNKISPRFPVLAIYCADRAKNLPGRPAWARGTPFPVFLPCPFASLSFALFYPFPFLPHHTVVCRGT